MSEDIQRYSMKPAKMRDDLERMRFDKMNKDLEYFKMTLLMNFCSIIILKLIEKVSHSIYVGRICRRICTRIHIYTKKYI